MILRQTIERLKDFKPMFIKVRGGIGAQGKNRGPGLSALRPMNVEDDTEKPGADIRAGFKLAKSAPRLEICFLDEIFRCGHIAGKAAGKAQQAPQVRQRDALKLVLSL